MTTMIVMDANQADAVRGETSPGHALAPVPLADGVTWALDLAVLTDPAHAIRHDALASYQQRDVLQSEFPSSTDTWAS